MQKIEAQIKIPQFKEAIIRSDRLNDFLSVESSVEMALNMNFDTLGAPQIRQGLSYYSTDTNSSNCISLGTFSKNASSDRKLLMQIGTLGTVTKIYYINPTTPNTAVLSRTLSASGGKARFAQLLDYTYMVNGALGDAVQTFNGTTWGTTNVDVLPKGDFIATFSALIWIANASTDKIYYTNTPTIAGLVTGGSSFLFKLSPADGEKITALKTSPNALLVFKENHIFRVYSESSADPYPAYFVGTYSQESIVEYFDAIYFHHSSGFYKFNYDAQPTPISERIQDFVRAIPRSAYGDIIGWRDDDAVYWSIGDVTVDSVLYSSCVLRYTPTKELWTVYSYTGTTIKSAITFDTGTTVFTLLGSSNLKLQYMSSVYADRTDGISYDLITRWTNITQYMSTLKAITHVSVSHEQLAGANVQIQFDNDKVNQWITIGSLTDSFVTTFNIPETPTFNRVRFRISGNILSDTISSKSRIIGIEIPVMVDYGIKL
jgi:hypothetical protein